MPSPILITGMHRSGTSILAEMLESLGVFLGADRERHLESRTFLQWNNWALSVAHCHWDTPENFFTLLQVPEARSRVVATLAANTASWVKMARFWGVRRLMNRPSHWGWKDPRTMITLPLWHGVFPKAKVIEIRRDPQAVARSLERRERDQLGNFDRFAASGFWRQFLSLRCLEPSAGESLCRKYWEALDRYITAEDPRLLRIQYETLIADPEGTLDSVLGFLEMDRPGGEKRKISRLVRAGLTTP